ncbi:hypothetical protein SAMN06265795_10679 [Noviherbaspirillum humi]|uniref:Uncharacterized protein n=1 Tax=Noviherbaspirillum humi TaxID=1688639 RepID=A0A239H3T9_9BURK|nr:hypothetical protein [Noviherbaspirillum humi]SNS76030.1 hypothetical protein SAMN06265795_10679 [Noviherbaspirillum humi]
MRAVVTLSLAGVLLLAPAVAFSAEGGPGGAVVQPFAAPVVLRGTLGERQIQMQLRPKTGEEGIEGDYFAFGSSAKVLLAGEADAGELVMEESENGTDVSGHWLGTVNGDSISGNWESLDGSVQRPFQLQVVRADKSRPAAAPRPAKQAEASKRP